MREAIGVSSIFQIVILFILVFTAIMALTINNSNAFGVKNEIIKAIEENNGKYLDEKKGLSKDIRNALADAGYRTTGKCEAGYSGFDRQGDPVTSGSRASICIKEVNATDDLDNYLSGNDGRDDSLNIGDAIATGDFITGKYYQVVVFFQMDIPVVNTVANFQTKGETKIIYTA